MKDEAVDLWALDEVHFQQQGSRCRMWIPPKIRTQSYFITLREKAWGTSEQSASGTADWCSAANPNDLTERPSGNSCGISGKRLSSLDGA